MKTVSFELTMPNRGSWNGKWSGQDNKYYIIRSFPNRYDLHFIPDGASNSFHYSWSDGWGANVNCQVINAIEAKKRKKISKGFCGYDWMVDSIVYYGVIAHTSERKLLLKQA